MVTTNRLEEALHECLDGKVCVQAWKGYGSAIFIGFGLETMPKVVRRGKHPRPPYELQTLFAEWVVKGPEGALADWDDDSDEVITSAIERLVGNRVLTWRYEPSRQSLHVELESGLSLFLVPYLERPDGGAWWFVIAEDDIVIGVESDGSLFESTYTY